MFRPRHRVSAKAAIYSHDASKLLLMTYGEGKVHGLAGGHVELNEMPDTTIVREIEEELGVSLPGEIFTHRDFFKSPQTKDRIIIAFTARLSEDITIHPPKPNKEDGVWMTKDEFAALTTISPEYKQFALENWPVVAA